ncbi:MAG: hypothetical protein IJ468_02925 [Lachnospiraceae bacterium]|nr:hypothetical protein [Lachnospiraceae bacterium]
MNTSVSCSSGCYYFHKNWKFLRADMFPMREAMESHRDARGNLFYERDYQEDGWKDVTLPHTFNDEDLFRDRIQDAGSGQKRTTAFYRKWFEVPAKHAGQKVLIEFEGMRQTCYLYVNGTLAGYYEAGTAPFGFDLTPWIRYDEKNLIAIATDNTTTRNIPFCIAETPNKPDAEPGSYLFPQDGEIPAGYHSGVGYFWNCNDFNPSLGGITRPVKLHFKPSVYLTLPLYSNLQTKGCYVYAEEYHLDSHTASLCVDAEIRNESGAPADVWLDVHVCRIDETEVFSFRSARTSIESVGVCRSPLSITPQDAYIWDEKAGQYVPQEEHLVGETKTDSFCVTVLSAKSGEEKMRFWSIDDPWLYRVEICLCSDDGCLDRTVIETGFPKIGYDKNLGVTINGEPVWLRGYAQRASNEWAAIGIAPEWLKDVDAKLIRESNANHIRFMHVAASPADIRSFDRHGIVCTQPAGDKERENFGRQWNQRLELMRDVIIAFRNHPSIFFWEAGNNSINREHMKQMRLLKETLDPNRGRFMGCRTINTEDVLAESEYVGTMLNRHAARFLAEHGPITETEYLREEAPRRIWDDFTPPDFDYDNLWLGKGGRKQVGADFYDLTSEELALAAAKGYSEFFHDRIGGGSQKGWYSACAALCWTDSAQHGRQAYSENGRMSGRVDAVRNKKQNFDVFRVMQSLEPQITIIGHWNYPQDDETNYLYPEKTFDSNVWVKNGNYSRRDPRNKTVYVFGSYPIAKVALFVNDVPAGCCEKPTDTFVFCFEHIDITQSGSICAVGYDYEGNPAAYDRIETAGDPARLNLSIHTAPSGLLADGQDVAYADVQVLDSEGRICPLCDLRIDFQLDGEGTFLGGYNSGRFDGFGHDDSVIHKNHVYAECGYNRVFLRSTRTAGSLTLTASLPDRPDICPVTVSATSSAVSPDDFIQEQPEVIYETYEEYPAKNRQHIPAILEADKQKYTPDDQLYCKILINGQEPDTRGIRSVNKNGSIWGAILCILERLKGSWGHMFDYSYDEKAKRLTLVSDGRTVIAEAGITHLLVDKTENLMDGEPYVVPENRQFVMEVNAIVTYIKGTKAYYDDKVNVYRIETIVEE